MVGTKFVFKQELAKEKMVFSKESRQAIFNMGNLELIEGKEDNDPVPIMLSLRF